MTDIISQIDPSVHLDEIAQIAITVHDLDRAKQFYGETLGMRLLFQAGTMAFFQCGSIRLMLGTPEQPTTCAGTILYFRVGDIGQAYNLLQERAVHFLQPPHHVATMPDHDLWMAFLEDPDHNTLALMSELPRAEPYLPS